MDTTGEIYFAIGIVVLIGMIVLFWLISKWSPKGVLLGVGIGLWFLGRTISSPTIREVRLIGGLCMMSGFIGGILGLFDLFPKKKAAEVPPVITVKPEPPPLRHENPSMTVLIFHYFKKFCPVWLFTFAWCMLGPLFATPRLYKEHPGIAWPAFFSLIIICAIYMIFLKRVMLRLLQDKLMSTTTRNVLWLIPTLIFAMTGMMLGLSLKHIIGW
jgi:hypothetical protein